MLKNLVWTGILCAILLGGCAPNKERKAAMLNRSAMELMDQGEKDSALAIMDRALKINPEEPELYSSKCRILWDMEKDTQALHTARKAIENVPASFRSHLLEGIALERTGEMQTAKESFQRAIDRLESSRGRTVYKTIDLVVLNTIVHGKERGSEMIAHVPDTLSYKEEKIWERHKNEIASYQGGGFLEFIGGDMNEYCIPQKGRTMKEIKDEFRKKGLNVEGFTPGDSLVKVAIKEKFQNKAGALGLKECGGED